MFLSEHIQTVNSFPWKFFYILPYLIQSHKNLHEKIHFKIYADASKGQLVLALLIKTRWNFGKSHMLECHNRGKEDKIGGTTGGK